MVKPVNLELLELALWQAYLTHVLKQDKARPLRAPLKEDVAKCGDLLAAMRHSWSPVASGKTTDTFPNVKRTVVNGMQKEQEWDGVTRNLLSSAVSIYMNWDRSRLTIKPETLQLLRTVRLIGTSIQKEYTDEN